jgi:hypothetical protein
MNLYEMKPNDPNLHPVHLLRSPAEPKMQLTVPMTLVRVAIQHLHTWTHIHSKFRVRVRDWQRSSNRSQAPSEFTCGARQSHTRYERGER